MNIKFSYTRPLIHIKINLEEIDKKQLNEVTEITKHIKGTYIYFKDKNGYFHFLIKTQKNGIIDLLKDKKITRIKDSELTCYGAYDFNVYKENRKRKTTTINEIVEDMKDIIYN